MGNRLLLADDSITIQKVVAIIFANEEFELTVVDNGTAALEKAREIQPDVMLVDALMPGKTGYEVCAEIRRDPKLNAVPLLLLIGAFEPLDEEKARECGADATVSKPFESQQLIDRVKEMLELGKNRKSAPAPAAPAAVAAPAALESAAEELWGDLSSFDTMPPSDVLAPPSAPAQAEQVWEEAAALAEPAAPAAPAAPAPAVVKEEMVEATADDDLWGAFEMEEAAAPPAEAPGALFGVVEPETEFEAEEVFGFDESEEIEETGPALEPEEALTVSEEEFFALTEEEPAPQAPVSLETEREADVSRFPEYQPFDFGAEKRQEAPAAAPQAAAAAAPAAPAAPQGGAAPVLTEAQLVEALSKVSREVIERIVWEVVPDLAETIIKEEIRKLKSGVRG